MNATSDVCERLDGIDPQKIVLDYNDKAVCDLSTGDSCNDRMDGPEIQRAELSCLVMEEGIHEE